MSSLRARLLAIIGASLVVLWGAVAAWMLVELRRELRATMDERLAASARMVAALAAQFPAAALRNGTAAPPSLDVVARDGLACEVSLLRGEVSSVKVARTAASPAMDDAAPGYGTQMFGGKLWRTYVLEQGGLRIATADRVDIREAMLRDIVLTAAVPFAIALAGGLLAVWIGVGGGLAPLEGVRRILASRRPDDDSPLPPHRVPRELAPLLDTIRRLLGRVRSAIDRERRFTDDAAHELRTPLTAVKTHLQVLRLALGEGARPEVADALSSAGEGVRRMQRSLEQLLLLARLDAGEEQPGPACDAAEAAREAAREARASGGDARIAIDIEAGNVPVAVPDRLVVSGVRNLLENALRASPHGEIRLQVALDTTPGRVAFRVLDRGPGMTQEECAQAARRFWRRDRGGPGQGLGLSIVAAIAERYGGTLSLAPRPGGGLCAELSLPARPEAHA